MNHLFRDAFSKREEANENYYVRQKEMEKLQAMREKIKKHQEHLEDLDKSMYADKIPCFDSSLRNAELNRLIRRRVRATRSNSGYYLECACSMTLHRARTLSGKEGIV